MTIAREIKEAFKKQEQPESALWRGRARHSVSHMEITYKCGCAITSYSEADHACSKHLKGIRRIARITEYLD